MVCGASTGQYYAALAALRELGESQPAFAGDQNVIALVSPSPWGAGKPPASLMPQHRALAHGLNVEGIRTSVRRLPEASR
jgi:hypothetical protein